MWPVIVVWALIGLMAAAPERKDEKKYQQEQAMTDKQQELGLYMMFYDGRNEK